MALPTFNQSASFINSLPNFTKQGQAAVMGSAANLNPGSSGMRVSNAVPTAPWAGPNTQLSVAGQTGYQQPSQNLPQFTLNQQGNIPSGPPPGYSGPPANVIWPDATASGPGGVRKGDYDARGLSQDQRQWLWEQFGHRGEAPLGYGGERPPAPVPPPAPVAPPPAMPPQTQVAAKPVGSTAALPSIGSTGAVGQKAFGATTAAGAAGKDLQSLRGVAPIPMPVPTPTQTPTTIPTGILNTLGNVGKGFIENLGKFSPINAKDILSGILNWGNEPQTQQTSKFPEPTPTPPQPGSTVTSAISTPTAPEPVPTLTPYRNIGDFYGNQVPTQVPESTQRQQYLNQPMPSLGDLFAGLNTGELFTPKAITTPELTGGKLTQTPVTDPTKKYSSISSTLPQEQHGQVLQMFNTGQISKEQAVQAIASPEAKVSIGKMINTAVKAGDFGAAKRLADLAPAIDEQLALINQIGRAVLATSQGFGTPNAPGVTEARMPMVQMGVGQALTTPRPDFSRAPISAQSATLAPYLRPRFDEVQQNRPPIFPYMNGQ